ncbi:MAG TPA: hypothetical protein VMG35_26645 [Bryobacteraceae bacterium]|nr:hypothetical protein [Bryobacteraceae bacterium]
MTTTYGYDRFGALTSIQYPGGATFTYSLDSLERPVGLTDSTNYTWASGVQYNAANQITNATFPVGARTWSYDSLQQLIGETATSGPTTLMNMTYAYNQGADNGQIASSTDAVTGEKITYQYDSLRRLISASSASYPSGTPIWSETYTLGGFGNMTGMTPTGSNPNLPTLSVSGDATTNRINSANIVYDNNGGSNSNGNIVQFGASHVARLPYVGSLGPKPGVLAVIRQAPSTASWLAQACSSMP